MASGGSVTIRSSLPTRPISLGGTNNAVQGINLTDAELACIATVKSLIIGDSSQTGNITLTTVTTPTYFGINYPVNTVIVQSVTGAGQIIFDNGGSSGPALNGSGGTISLTPGTGGVHVVSSSGPTISNGNLVVNGQLVADNLSLDGTDTATFRIDGTMAGSQYDQIAATGTVNLCERHRYRAIPLQFKLYRGTGRRDHVDQQPQPGHRGILAVEHDFDRRGDRCRDWRRVQQLRLPHLLQRQVWQQPRQCRPGAQTRFTDTDPTANMVPEGSAVGTHVGITLPWVFPNDPFPVTYTLNNSAFQVEDPTSGVVTVLNGSLLSYEDPQSRTQMVTISASDVQSGGEITVSCP